MTLQRTAEERFSPRSVSEERQGGCSPAEDQQENDPEHGSKSTAEGLQTKKIHILEWSSQSPDPNPTEMLLTGLRDLPSGRPENVSELKVP